MSALTAACHAPRAWPAPKPAHLGQPAGRGCLKQCCCSMHAVGAATGPGSSPSMTRERSLATLKAAGNLEGSCDQRAALPAERQPSQAARRPRAATWAAPPAQRTGHIPIAHDGHRGAVHKDCFAGHKASGLGQGLQEWMGKQVQAGAGRQARPAGAEEQQASAHGEMGAGHT